MGLDNPLHIAFLLVILLLVFGARRLPEIGRSLGSGLREFKQSISGESHSPSQSHDNERPTLSAGAPQAPPPEPEPVQEPVAQRDPAATDRR
jgi:sec-independent protein translocase protein TatA